MNKHNPISEIDAGATPFVSLNVPTLAELQTLDMRDCRILYDGIQAAIDGLASIINQPRATFENENGHPEYTDGAKPLERLLDCLCVYGEKIATVAEAHEPTDIRDAECKAWIRLKHGVETSDCLLTHATLALKCAKEIDVFRKKAVRA